MRLCRDRYHLVQFVEKHYLPGEQVKFLDETGIDENLI